MKHENLSLLDNIERKIEAILFAGGDPVDTEKIAEILDIDVKTVKNLIERIRARYAEQQSPFDIVALSGAYQMCTLPEYEDVIRATLTLRKNTPLSAAALEVLAVVAYHQPVTKALIEQVRGVDCSYIVRSLVEKGLIQEAGRMNVPGRPISYATTQLFLRCFGLEDLGQLPTLPIESPEDYETDPEQLEGQLEFPTGLRPESMRSAVP